MKMKFLGALAALSLLGMGVAKLTEPERAGTGHQASGTLAQAPSSAVSHRRANGKTLGSFAEVWPARRGAEEVANRERVPEQTNEQQRQRRAAAFIARMDRSDTGSLPSRPGDRAGLRDGDRVVARHGTAAPVRSVEEVAVDRARAQQVATRVHAFHASMEKRLAAAQAEQDLQDQPAASTTRGRPGDQVSARAGDIASLQRKHP